MFILKAGYDLIDNTTIVNAFHGQTIDEADWDWTGTTTTTTIGEDNMNGDYTYSKRFPTSRGIRIELPTVKTASSGNQSGMDLLIKLSFKGDGLKSHSAAKRQIDPFESIGTQQQIS